MVMQNAIQTAIFRCQMTFCKTEPVGLIDITGDMSDLGKEDVVKSDRNMSVQPAQVSLTCTPLKLTEQTHGPGKSIEHVKDIKKTTPSSLVPPSPVVTTLDDDANNAPSTSYDSQSLEANINAQSVPLVPSRGGKTKKQSRKKATPSRMCTRSSNSGTYIKSSFTNPFDTDTEEDM
jgi:hypothetical protein